LQGTADSTSFSSKNAKFDTGNIIVVNEHAANYATYKSSGKIPRRIAAVKILAQGGY